MIPRLYAAGSTVFTSEGLGALSDAISCITTTSINGVPSLTMTYPTTGVHASEIGERCVIVADRDRTRTKQPYMVLTIDKTTPGIMKIYAEHLAVCLLDGIGLGAYTATNLSLAISTMGNYATEALPVTISTELSSSTDFNHAIPSTVKKALGGMEGSLLDTYGGEWDFVDLAAVLRTRMGADNGVIIRWGKNLSSLRVNIDWSGVYTGIYPYWENDGTVVQMSSPVYSLGTFSFTRILMLDCSSEFRDQPSEADLLAYAQAYAAAHDLTSPVYSWSVGFVELRGAPEYASVTLLEDVSIGDTVRIYLPDFDVNATARVVKETYDVLLEQYQKLEIGAVKASLAQTITQQTETAQTAIKTATNSLYNAIQEATEAITGNKGGYIRTVLNSDGEPTELLIMDTTDINTAQKVWRWNLSGLGYSSTGYAGPYTLAVNTTAGAINADFVTVGQLAANVVTACNLISGTIQSADGTTFVLDLDTGNLTIDGTTGGINLKNCGINIQASETFEAANYSSSDTNRITQILLGNVTPTSADYEKYDFYNDGSITITDQLLCLRIVNSGLDLVVTWYAQMDTSKSEILKIWRVLSGAQSATQTIFNAGISGVSMVNATQMTSLTGAPSEHKIDNYNFTADAALTVGDITIPKYSKGAYSCNGNDAFIIAVDPSGNFYCGYRSNGNWRTQVHGMYKTEVSVTSGTAVSFSLSQGQTAFISFATSDTANANIHLKVNGADATNSSYTYAGNTANFGGQKIFARAGGDAVGTFTGYISCHGGITEVTGTGRRGDGANAMGVTYLAWGSSTVSNLTFDANGTLTILKLG